MSEPTATYGEGPPKVSGSEVDGDTYLDTLTNEGYQFFDPDWVPVGPIMVDLPSS